MRKAKIFLELLTEKVPPDRVAKHNLTLSDDGRLQITIIKGGRSQSLTMNVIKLPTWMLRVVKTV